MTKPSQTKEQPTPKPDPEEIKQKQDDILSDDQLDDAAGGFSEMQ